MLEIIYLSRLKIIAPHKKAKMILIIRFSKIIESAKKDETTASIAVKTIVIPILEYFVISNLGQFSNISKLAPEHLINNLFIKFTFIEGSINKIFF
tara:strand:- start:914 stop:1201 length:288 start_codon:yes stop_codon:yes gene_type:complete